jgi:hypothetical protein
MAHGKYCVRWLHGTFWFDPEAHTIVLRATMILAFLTHLPLQARLVFS